jgi:transcriptional regulator with XRE-family HTH domain
LREKRDLSQTQLADLSEIGRAHISQIENETIAARIETLYVIANALEMSRSELMQDL